MDWSHWTDARLILAGALGGVVNWLTRKAGWRDGLGQIVVGAICGLYLSPLAIPAMGSVLGNIVATPEELSRLSGFLIGVGGVSVSGFVLDLWNRRRAALVPPDGSDK